MIIGNRELTKENPFIIAEVGSCWKTWEHCKDSIMIAKNCGADAVKFQYFQPAELYGPIENLVKPVTGGFSPYLHHGWLPGLKEKCDAAGIELMCSAFSVAGLNFVDQFVNVHKVASSENNHVRLLQRLREIGKPVFLSTGGSSIGDVRKSYEVLVGDKPPLGTPDLPPADVALLYCVSDYPARRIDLDSLAELSAISGAVGFSDHSTDSLVIPKCASDMGAVVVEKHVNFFDVESDDSGHSLDREEFKAMCDRLRGRPVTPSGQADMVQKHNRRLIATKNIAAGEELKEGINFGIYRSLKQETRAFSPFMIDSLKGKKARRPLTAGDGIGPGDVE